MKKLIIAMSLTLLTVTLSAQSAVDKVFNKYAGKDGYTTVVINKFMFQFLSNIQTGDPEYESFKNATSGIESIRILTRDSKGSAAFGQELLELLPRKEYQEMMTVKEANEEVVFLVKEVGGEIREFLLVVSGVNKDVLIAINGVIDLKSIASLTKGMDLPAMESLKELDK